MLSVYGSSQDPSLLMGYPLRLPPFLQKRLTAPGIARLARHQRGDPIGAKVSESLAQLAPGDDNPRAIEEAEGKGPDRAPFLHCIAIHIGNRDLAFPPDPLPYPPPP